MFDFNKPNIEITEMSEDKNMADLLWSHWKGATEQRLVTASEELCCPLCLERQLAR